MENENIQVALRIRPLNYSELQNNDQEIWQSYNPYSISLTPEMQNELVKAKKMGIGHRSEFTYNNCFDKYKTNVDVYESLAKRIAISSLQGINGTVFMYGQTGSGKTFTMVGSKEQQIKTHSQSFTAGANDRITPKNQNNSFLAPVSNKTPKNQPVVETTATTRTPRNTQPQSESENPLRAASKVSFYRSKSPISSRPLRADKSPLKTTRDKSPANGRYSTKPNDKENSSSSAHKRSATLPSSQKVNLQINTFGNPEELFDFSKPCEMDSLRSNPQNSDGVLMLAMKDIFYEVEKQKDKKFLLKCSYLEIYTDLVYDLLKPQDKLAEVLHVSEDENKEFYIKGATQEIVSSLEEIIQKIKKGESNRHYASTAMNHASSRSHTIFRLYVESMPTKTNLDQDTYYTESVLNFVDLAGSEKVNIHDALRPNKRGDMGEDYSLNSLSPNKVTLHKERVKENQHINKSLFFLTRVISLKSQGKSDLAIPYRDSPLTKILRSSLGGNSRTAVILCVNPSLSQYEQTMSTLRFGLNAKKIENQIHANVIRDKEDEVLKTLLREYENKIRDMELEKNKEKSNSEKMMRLIENLQEQKNLLADRLQRLKKAELFPARIDIIPNERNYHEWQDIHYPNVGILHVKGSRAERRRVSKFEIEDKGLSQPSKNLKEQNELLLEKINKITRKFEKEKRDLIDALSTKDKYLLKKEATIKLLNNKVNESNAKTSQLQQVINLYQNKNSEGIKRLNLDQLMKLESSLSTVIDTIKLHKAMKVIHQALPNEPEDTENNKLFKSYLYEIVDKERSLKPGLTFTGEVDFGTQFYDSQPVITIEPPKDLNHSEDQTNTNNESGECEIIVPAVQDLHTFQNYFRSSDYKLDRYETYENEEMESLEFRLSKLRGSYRKMNERASKNDNLVLQTSVAEMEESFRDELVPEEIFGDKRLPLSSPRYTTDKATPSRSRIELADTVIENFSEGLKMTNSGYDIKSAENSERGGGIGVLSELNILKNLEERPFRLKPPPALEKKKTHVPKKESIRIENINLTIANKENKEPRKSIPQVSLDQNVTLRTKNS